MACNIGNTPRNLGCLSKACDGNRPISSADRNIRSRIGYSTESRSTHDRTLHIHRHNRHSLPLVLLQSTHTHQLLARGTRNRTFRANCSKAFRETPLGLLIITKLTLQVDNPCIALTFLPNVTFTPRPIESAIQKSSLLKLCAIAACYARRSFLRGRSLAWL